MTTARKQIEALIGVELSDWLSENQCLSLIGKYPDPDDLRDWALSLAEAERDWESRAFDAELRHLHDNQ